MKYLKLIALISFTGCLMLTACHLDDDGFFNCEKGSGDVVSRELQMNSFSAIELKIDADIYITQGNETKVVAEGQSNIIDLLELDIQDDTWEIELDHCARDYDDLRIYITMSDIDKISVSGSGQVYGENTFEVGDLVLRVSGSGDIKIKVDAKYLDARISGSGKMLLNGFTEKFDFRISGSGDYKAFGMESLIGNIDISGSGDVEVFVVDELDIKISGSGDVLYKGYPVLNVNISGSGDVIDAN